MSQARSKLFTECMDFLYTWVEKGVITNGIRKGAPEELEAFINQKLSEAELARAAQNMRSQAVNLLDPEFVVDIKTNIKTGDQQ